LLAIHNRRAASGGIEISIVTLAAALSAQCPMSFELHFSGAAEIVDAVRGGTFNYEENHTDPDLAAHITVARARGVAVFGSNPSDVFAPVSWKDYRSAVLGDIYWSLDPQRFGSKPSYFVLNACRVLQLDDLGEGTVASKEEGASWALKALPAHRAVITAALDSYRSPELSDNLWVEREALKEFTDFVRTQMDAMRDK
jgi:streptomycin 3"-adenylyltransferase